MNAETLSQKPLDGEIAEVEFEKRSVTIALANAETLGIALAGKLEELVTELLVMTLAREESKTLGTRLFDKLADAEVELLSVEMIGKTKTLNDSLVDKLTSWCGVGGRVTGCNNYRGRDRDDWRLSA